MYNILAVTVDREYIKHDKFKGVSVIPFDEIQNHFPPSKCSMFVAIGYQEMNKLREEKYKAVQSLGYQSVSIISPKTNLPNTVEIGENCFIMPPAIIHPEVTIGNNTFVWSGAMIGHHSSIGENCWLTSTANISGVVNVGKNCFFAVNSTVGHGVNIGDACFIGANALVTKSLENKKVVIVESSNIFRLDSDQFIRFSKFADI